jgi:uncharacterized membrane protein
VYGSEGYGGPRPGGRPARFWILLCVGLAMMAILVTFAVLLWTGTISYGTGARPYPVYWGGFFLIFILLWVSFFIIRMAFWSSRGYRGFQGRRGQGTGRDPAVMAARQRYARGEITREQYDQIMTDLGRRGRGPGGPLSGA